MWTCNTCGTMHASADAECCGEKVTPFDVALQYQERLFEASGDDRALNVLRALKNEAEAASQKVVKTEEKLPQLIAARDAAEGVLLDFYKLTHADGPSQPALPTDS